VTTDRLFLVEEVAERLRLSAEEVERLIETGELPAVRIPPNLLRVTPDHLKQFLKARTVPFVVARRVE
jgi:excisionase family DNA binding protein